MIEESVVHHAKQKPPTTAAKEAKSLGLRYAGFGRYEDKTRKVTHVVINGKLERFAGKEDVAKHQTSTKDTAKSDFRKARSVNAGTERSDKGYWKDIQKDGVDTNKKLKPHAKVLKSKLTPDQQEAFDWYKNEGYVTINNYLNGKNPEGGKWTPELQNQLMELVSVLNSIFPDNAAPFDYTVYSGLSARYKPEDFELKGEYEFKGFLSTSTSPLSASNFTDEKASKGTPIVLEIDVKKGQHAVPFLDAGEDEVLLPRDTSIKVVSGPHIVPGRGIGRTGPKSLTDQNFAFFKCVIVDETKENKKKAK